jgi:metal-sulfur cluster biosynthetic enzyme
VHLELSLTTPGCPLQDSLPAAAERAVSMQVPGVLTVDVRLTFEPRWTPERVSPDARRRLGFDR